MLPVGVFRTGSEGRRNILARFLGLSGGGLPEALLAPDETRLDGVSSMMALDGLVCFSV